jgi:hypothetical protein
LLIRIIYINFAGINLNLNLTFYNGLIQFPNSRNRNGPGYGQYPDYS